MNKFTNSIIILALLLVSSFTTVFAQSPETGPIYIVQSGDTLNIIASRFGVSPNDIIAINNLTNPDVLSAGMPLTIPGLEGVSGILTTTIIPLGQSLTSLSREYNVSISTLSKLNHLTSPAELYAGASLIIPQSDTLNTSYSALTLERNQSSLEQAVIKHINPWLLSRYNSLPTIWNAPASEILYYPNPSANEKSVSPLNPNIESISISPLPLVQGTTAVITIKTAEEANISGTLNGSELHFFANGDKTYTALQGIHAMANPGLAPFQLNVQFTNDQPFNFEQMLLLQSGYYPKDPPLYVDEETIDPAVTKPEEELITGIVSRITPQRYWNEAFRQPVDDPICIKSWFGNRRSYNGSDFVYFHTGVDYGVCANLNIYASAPGVVVFTGNLSVRGNATIIDHGWGVYTAYYHQSAILVNVGDTVQAGQKIGEIGKTGRVTGPHLHWEVWVNEVQVEPLDWLDKAYSIN